MANYNPNAPIILGQEWVPIREENLAFNEQVNSLEMGHSFTLATPTQLSVGRFYINKFPTSAMNNQAYTMAVYPKGMEDKSGPVRSVIIPCNSVASTGLPTQIGTLDNVTRLSNSSADPDMGIQMQIGTATAQDLSIWFATSDYEDLLDNKRILGVNFLSNARFTNINGVVAANPLLPTNGIFLQMRNEGNTNRWNFPLYMDDFSPERTNNPRTDRLGDVDRFFGGSIANVPDVIPMTYDGFLDKFEADSGVERINMHFRTPISNPVFNGPIMFLNYAALEVFYCEETRVAFGTKIYNPWNQSPFLGNFPIMGGIPYQTNPIIMRDLDGNANPILPAGEYVVTIAEANLGDDLEVVVNAGPHAELNALRELYRIPGIEGRMVNIPFPLDRGTTSTPHTMTAEDTHVLPQISLHVSGGAPFQEVHVYGRQAIAQVYDDITATQDISDYVAPAGTPYPWVRFYARRFGETTVPLTLSSFSPSVSGSGMSVSITPDEWDALPEILDRWKEVTLRFPDATPPLMGGGFIPAWTWSATGEEAGNRWEVLGACAPAISGLPGNLLNLAVPPVSQLGPATYGSGGSQTASFVSAGVAAHGNNASVQPGLPPGILQGDLLLIHAAIRNSPNGNPARPDGYLQLMSSSNMRLFGKYYDGVEGAPTVTFDDGVANATTSAQMAAFRNVSIGVLASANQSNASAANIAYPGIASGAMEDNTLVLFLGWRAQDWTSVDTIVGATEIGDPSSGLGDNQGIVWDYVFRGAAAAVGSGSFVVNGGVAGISRGANVVFRVGVPGSLVNLTWMPQGVGSPYVSDEEEDVTSDAALFFSQDPPPVSGFALSMLSQALTGIGQQCDLDPMGIPTELDYHRLTWTSLSSSGFVTELQRMDTVDNAWQTIMLSSDSRAVSGFNDYEARVGILSSYRIRHLNSYGFYGPWSATVTGTIPDPGVTVGVTDGHVLIFTTNSRQNGSSNLAYVPIWDVGTVITEDFSFPESGFTTLQAMYNKNFFTAFRPLERGGERFQRRILVQAAAIAPETLADFTSLRNMAWDSVPYICVRDEDGNRWLASINVPGGRVQRGRRLYEATIDVIEVTDTPSQVDP